jgi:Xaa-Pro aminopeptidase
VDIFPRMSKSGYWGDITRTFCVGEPRTELAVLHATVLSAQKRALAEIREGCDGKQLQDSVREEFCAKGYVTGVQDGRHVGFFHGLGHGVGLEIHESPRISAGKLRAGHVVTVEPGLYFPGLGGVRIEDLVVVTEKGCKNLTKFPKDWRVKR